MLGLYNIILKQNIQFYNAQGLNDKCLWFESMLNVSQRASRLRVRDFKPNSNFKIAKAYKGDTFK